MFEKVHQAPFWLRETGTMMKSWTVNQRIILGFSAIVLTMVALSLFASMRLSSIEAQTARLRRDSIPALYIVGRLSAVSVETYTGVQQLVLEQDPARMQEIASFVRQKTLERLELLKQAPNPFVEELQERINLVAARPWGVQLSAGFSRERILAAYSALFKRLGEILSGHDPSILTSILRNRGTRPFYQVRIGAETRESANGLCAKIMRAGGACLVLRNTGRSR